LYFLQFYLYNNLLLSYNIRNSLYSYKLKWKNAKMEQLVKIFKALSNNVRLEILSLLAERPFCVNALVNRLNMSQPAVSQHLRILENAGLVKGSKMGYWVHYSLVPENFAECRSFLEKLILSSS